MTMPLNTADRAIAQPENWTTFWPRFELQSTARVNRRRHATKHVARLLRWYMFDSVGICISVLLISAMQPISGWGHIMEWSNPSFGIWSIVAQSVLAVCSGLFLVHAYDDGDAVCDFGRVVLGVALGLLVVHWSLVWQHGMTVFTSYIPCLVVFSSLVWGARRYGNRLLSVVWPNLIEPARALFVGSAAEVAAALQQNPLKGSHALLRVAEIDPAIETGESGGAHSPLDTRLQSAIYDHDVDTTLLCSQFGDDQLSQIVGMSEATGCRVLSLSRLYSVSKLSPKLKTYGNTPIVELTQPGIRGRDLVFKRVFDLVAASILLLALAPLMFLVALLVKRSSPGPALFRQERVGYRGRSFHILKFRSMRADAEQHLEELRNESIYADARLFKVIDDPRVTTLGHFLRRSSIDELPQLLNVVGGSMSLVGPRPPLPREVETYGNRSFLRFDVKPGITGPWQVNGRNSITSFDEVIALEADYVSGWTIWRDFAILARTVPVVLRMEGAR